MTDTFIKIKGIWHIKEKDGSIGNRPASVLLCKGISVPKIFTESKDVKGDEDPLCELCQNPLSADIKLKINSKC